MPGLFSDVLDFFKGSAASSGDEAARRHGLELATAVLLVEVMRSDGDASAAELDAVVRVLQSRFTLTPVELESLIERARHTSEHAHDLYSFTERLNESLDEAERTRVFESLWRVAYADGRADAHEAHLLRRVADLLHLRHGDAIGARLRAEKS